MSRVEALDKWLATATSRLYDDAVARISEETRAHFEDAYADALRQGCSEEDALNAAVNSLGNPRQAGRRFRKVYLVKGVIEYAQNRFFFDKFVGVCFAILLFFNVDEMVRSTELHLRDGETPLLVSGFATSIHRALSVERSVNVFNIVECAGPYIVFVLAAIALLSMWAMSKQAILRLHPQTDIRHRWLVESPACIIFCLTVASTIGLATTVPASGTGTFMFDLWGHCFQTFLYGFILFGRFFIYRKLSTYVRIPGA